MCPRARGPSAVDDGIAAHKTGAQSARYGGESLPNFVPCPCSVVHVGPLSTAKVAGGDASDRALPATEYGR